MTPKDFVKKYKPFALESEKKTGISHLFTLAQAALESRWGERAEGYNFFGIKAKATTPLPNKQLWVTKEELAVPNSNKFPEVLSITKLSNGKYLYRVKDWFMKYSTPEEGFSAHSQFFFINKRYAKALLVRNDPYKFADEVAKAGYATAPDYANSLKKIIKMLESYE